MARKTTTVAHRQAKAVWEVRHIIPDEFRDRIPAKHISDRPPESLACKIARCFTVEVGAKLADEEYGYLWQIVDTIGYCQKHDSKKRGRAPICWVRLISLDASSYCPS